MSFNITPVASGYQEIHPYSAMNIDSVKINISLIMMKECPYTASSRDALENTPTSALEISLGWGFCTPRPSRLPSGNLLGLGVQNPHPWEIFWASGGVFSNTSLLSAVYGFNILASTVEMQPYWDPSPQNLVQINSDFASRFPP